MIDGSLWFLRCYLYCKFVGSLIFIVLNYQGLIFLPQSKISYHFQSIFHKNFGSDHPQPKTSIQPQIPSTIPKISSLKRKTYPLKYFLEIPSHKASHSSNYKFPILSNGRQFRKHHLLYLYMQITIAYIPLKKEMMNKK